MRIQILPLLRNRACVRQETVLMRRYAFVPGFDWSELPSATVLATEGKKVELTDTVVFKHYALPLTDRLFGCRLDVDRGLLGGYAEALHTLIVNQLGVASPKLLGLSIDLLRGRLTLAQTRLHDCVSLAEMLPDKDPAALCAHIFPLLHATLQRGIYHVDPNASNIMVNPAANRWYLIDFEQILPLGCTPATAFALQAAAFWDWRVQAHVSRECFRQQVEDYLRTDMDCLSPATALALFDTYSLSRPGRAARLQRLRIAAGGSTDIRPLLRQAGLSSVPSA